VTIMGIVLSSQHLFIFIGSVLVMSATLKVSSCNSIDLDLVLPTKLLVLLLNPCRFWRFGNDTN
jgi:hypothetical protein